MKKNGFLNLVLVLSFLFSNLGAIPANQNAYITPRDSWNLKTVIGKMGFWLDGLREVSLETEKMNETQDYPTSTPAIGPVKTDTPTPSIDPTSWVQPTQTASPTPTETPWLSPTPSIDPTEWVQPTQTASLTPTDTITPTLTPTPSNTITPTLTPTPEPGLVLASLDITLEPDPAAPGDVITATWTIKNYRGGWDDVEFWLYLPDAFIPLELGNGTFDPETNLLILPIREASGLISWFIDGKAQPPYDFTVEVHVNKQVLLSVQRSLGKRGPDFIPTEGGDACGFNQKVRVNFPPGALPEAADVQVIAPGNTDLSLGGQPIELTATGRVSGMEITEFNQPVTITVQYTDEEAAKKLELAGMKDETSLTMFYYDETMGTWRPLTTLVDPEKNQLTAVTEHFTLFDYKAQNWEASRLPSLEAFQVAGFTGAGTYSYPIQVPPGPGGLQPSLEISHNTQVVDAASSRSQASWVGMGWSLDTGYIQRNMNGTPSYFDDDAFSLEVNGVGGLLLPIADQDGDPNTNDFHFADERFWRVRQYLVTGNVGGYQGDTGYWVAWDPSGNQYYFGNYADGSTGGHAWYPAYPSGCASITMQTWRWSMTRVRNIIGKELTYTYNVESAPSPKFAEGCSGYRAYMAVAMYPDAIVYPNNRYRVVFVREKDANGVGYRTDYDSAWNDAQSTVLYMRSKLLRVEIWQDPNGSWNSGDEVLIRKYVLGYGENNQQLFPEVTWPAGGKTPTLTSITEYGLNGTNALPATTFTYDNMHLNYAKNGYGGKVSYGYSEWHAADGAETISCGYISGVINGTVDIMTSYPLCHDFHDVFPGYFHPGEAYKLKVLARRAGGTQISPGFNTGGGNTLAPAQTIPVGSNYQTMIFELVIPATASQARPVLWCDGCEVDGYYITPVVTRYRVTSKTLTDEVANSTYTYQYAYEGAAVNDTTTSLYVATYPDGVRLMTKPYSEFRGHSHVTETDPDGRVVETWYKQDDRYKGQAYQTRVRDSSGNIYTQSTSSFASQEFPAYNLPHPQGQQSDFYQDLEIWWTYTTSEEMRTYNGDSTYVANRNDYQYNTADQGGIQYGNRTRNISYYWDGSAWVSYRGTWTSYYPKVTNGTPENSRYLMGLPGFTNTYKCPGSCDWATDDAIGSQWYLYDGNTMYNVQPIDGKLTGNRMLVDFANLMYTDTSFAYDAWGNRTTVTLYTGTTGLNNFGSGSGAQASYTCFGGGGSLNGHACSTESYHTYPTWERNALDQETTYTYDQAEGVLTDVRDPNLVFTRVRYDEFGRIVKILRIGDDIDNPTASMSYHPASGNFADNPFWTEMQQRISGSTYFKIRKYYNGLGQLLQTQVVGATIGAQTRDILADTFYDAGGRVYRQTVPYDVATGSNYHVRSTSAAYTQTTYDVLGRTTETKATDGTPISYTYTDGYASSVPYLETTVTNARGYATTTRSDIWGRVVKVTPPGGPTVAYTYDAADKLLTVVRGGLTTTLTYDFGGRKTNMSDPDMGAWIYTYDALGNLKTQTDARGCITTLAYDSLNRPTSKTYSGTNCTTPSVSYYYDEGGAAAYEIGQRTRMVDGSGSTTWDYDARGRMTQETKAITGSGTFVTQWGYNSADLTTWMKYPANNTSGVGEQVNFTYLNQMLLDTVIGTNTYVKNTDYEAAGRVDVRDVGVSGSDPVIRVDFTYFLWTDVNGQGRLKQITSGVMSDLDSLQDLRYTYDANGDVLTIKDYLAGSPQTQTFTYDALDRLTSAVAVNGTNGLYALQYYSYNTTSGNLSSKAGVNYTYGDTNHDHAVTQMGSDTYSYDNNGNQITRNVSGSSYTLSYDAENHLVGVTGAATQTFVYDGDGNRVKSTGSYMNLAAGIVPTGDVTINNASVITDNDTWAENSSQYAAAASTGLHYVKIDLGAIYSVNKINVWHYGIDGRTYHGTKTQVSANGTSWVTVYDSAVSGEYQETPQGKTITFTAQNVRYVRDYVNGNTVNAYDHWTEIEVWGQGTVAYVGNYLEWTGNTNTMEKYYYAGSTRVAVRRGANSLYWLLGDHLGSQAITTDANGSKISEVRYYPWGGDRYYAYTSSTTFRFTGQRTEDYIKLYWYGSRWYDSALGRFIQPDPIIPSIGEDSTPNGIGYVPQSNYSTLVVDYHETQFLEQLSSENGLRLQNQKVQLPAVPKNVLAFDRYAYSQNNPVKYTDPSGHCVWDLCIVEGFGLVEITILAGATFLTLEATQPGRPEAFAQTLFDFGEEAINGIQTLFSKNDWVPPGMTKEQRDLWGKAAELYKKGLELPPGFQLPKPFAQKLKELIQQGLTPEKAADALDELEDSENEDK